MLIQKNTTKKSSPIYIHTKQLLVYRFLLINIKHKTFKFYLEKYRKQNWDEKEYTKENSYI